jgi:hypothetical protein
MKRAFFAIGIFWLIVYFYFAHRNQAPVPERHVRHSAPAPQVQPSEPQPPPTAAVPPVQPSQPEEPEIVTDPQQPHRKPVLHYKLHNGLMVVQGDVVVGVPTHPDVPDAGLVQINPLKLWPKGRVPYHIQPDVPNPERILAAIAMFDGTAIHITPYNGEDDALVFQVGDKDCLSYVGRMVGKQPVWISPDCQAPEIAHEILHALGFVHEQNRTDRDNYIVVHMENVDERYVDNFEKLPQQFMSVSGLGEFDFQSLMMYPPWMFAKNGQSTMEPIVKDKLIAPSQRLSPGDIERLNRAYDGK